MALVSFSDDTCSQDVLSCEGLSTSLLHRWRVSSHTQSTTSTLLPVSYWSPSYASWDSLEPSSFSVLETKPWKHSWVSSRGLQLDSWDAEDHSLSCCCCCGWCCSWKKSCCSQLRCQRCVEKKSEPEEDSSWSDQTCVGREASAASVTSTASENKTGRSTREVVQDPPLTPPPTPVIGLKDKKCKTVWETKSKKRTVHSWRGIEVRKTRRKEKHLLFILLQETVLTKERKRHE